MQSLVREPNFKLLKQLIDREIVAPIDRTLTTKPFDNLSDVDRLQGERKGLQAVFSFVEKVSKTKIEE
jgi:hypothetical protein